MKRWIRWAAWLYPAEWRMRYGPEFDVFLNDAPLRWHDLADVIRGAAIMQMTSWMTYWKMALLAGVAGAILAGGIAFAIQDRYVCTSVLAVEKAGGTLRQSQKALYTAAQKILSLDQLIELLQDPKLGLYEKERQRLAVKDVAEDIFRKNVHVVPYASSDDSGQAFRVVFVYPDRYKAQALVERLTEAFQRELSRPSDGLTLSVLENPTLPDRPTSPVRPVYATFGAIGGCLLGLLSLAIFRRTRTYAVVTVDIPRDAKRFVESQVAAGQYRSVSDYVRELIRADEQKHK